MQWLKLSADHVTGYPWKEFQASGYHIYQAQGKAGFGSGPPEQQNYRQDTEIEGITSYAYAVRPYKNVDGKKVFGGYQAKQLYPVLSGTSEKISSVREDLLRGAEDLLEAQKKQIAIRSTVRRPERGHGKRSVQFPEAAAHPLRIRPQKEQRITMRCVQG